MAALVGHAVAEEAALLTEAKTQSPLSMELSSGYNFALREVTKDVEGAPKINTVGLTFSGVYRLSAKDALVANLSYATGSKSESGIDIDDEGSYKFTDDYTLDTYALTVGYRRMFDLNDKISAFVGVNLGIANNRVKVKEDDSDGFEMTIKGSAYGFAYSLEAGVDYAVTENANIFLIGQFAGNTASPEYKIYGVKIADGCDQLNLALRVGVRCSF